MSIADLLKTMINGIKLHDKLSRPTIRFYPYRFIANGCPFRDK